MFSRANSSNRKCVRKMRTLIINKYTNDTNEDACSLRYAHFRFTVLKEFVFNLINNSSEPRANDMKTKCVIESGEKLACIYNINCDFLVETNARVFIVSHER